MIIQISLDDVVNTLNRWKKDLGLDFHGQKNNKVAAWSTGNCLITASRLSNTNTEVELRLFRREGPNEKASQAWNLLGDKLIEAHWATEFTRVEPDALLEHTTNTLGEMAQNWQQTEAEWKSSRCAELKILMPNTDEDNIERQIKEEWQSQIQAIEGLRAEYQARQSVANKTAVEAAEEFFVSVQAVQPTTDNQEFELRFNGTPAQFGVMAETFSRRLFQKYKREIFILQSPTNADANPVSVMFGGPEAKAAWEFGWVTAQSQPSNKSLLIVQARGEDWPNLEEWWELLHEEMGRQGWIEKPQPVEHTRSNEQANNSKPGRRSYPDDTWARQEVANGRSKMEVYKEWVIRPEVKARELADPLESFNKLIKPKSKKKRKNE